MHLMTRDTRNSWIKTVASAPGLKHSRRAAQRLPCAWHSIPSEIRAMAMFTKGKGGVLKVAQLMSGEVETQTQAKPLSPPRRLHGRCAEDITAFGLLSQLQLLHSHQIPRWLITSGLAALSTPAHVWPARSPVCVPGVTWCVPRPPRLRCSCYHNEIIY